MSALPWKGEIAMWTIEETSIWLHKAGLDDCIPAFREKLIDGHQLTNLSEFACHKLGSEISKASKRKLWECVQCISPVPIRIKEVSKVPEEIRPPVPSQPAVDTGRYRVAVVPPPTFPPPTQVSTPHNVIPSPPKGFISTAKPRLVSIQSSVAEPPRLTHEPPVTQPVPPFRQPEPPVTQPEPPLLPSEPPPWEEEVYLEYQRSSQPTDNARSPDKPVATVSPTPRSGLDLHESWGNRELPPLPDEMKQVDKMAADNAHNLGLLWLDLSAHPWYHGAINRGETEKRLRRIGKDGNFLVRDCSQGPRSPFTLAVWYDQTVRNIQISLRANQQYSLGSEKVGEKTFEHVSELIRFHEINPLFFADTVESLVRLSGTPDKDNCGYTMGE